MRDSPFFFAVTIYNGIDKYINNALFKHTNLVIMVNNSGLVIEYA
jgi:hypothetical protein